MSSLPASSLSSSGTGAKLAPFGETKSLMTTQAEWADRWRQHPTPVSGEQQRHHSTTAESETKQTTTSSSSTSNIGYIIGGVVGVIIVALTIRYFLNQRKRARLSGGGGRGGGPTYATLPYIPSQNAFDDYTGSGADNGGGDLGNAADSGMDRQGTID